MPEVIVRKGEPVDRALKRLKNKLDAEGILEEVRRLRAFETPNQKSRRKAKANAKRGPDQVPFQSVVALAAFVGPFVFLTCRARRQSAVTTNNASPARRLRLFIAFADDSETKIIARVIRRIGTAGGRA